MKFWNNLKNQNWFPIAFALCIAVAFFMLLNHLYVFGNFCSWMWAVLKPLFYGLIIAYLVDPIARFYNVKLFSGMKKQKLGRTISVILALVSVVLVIVLIVVAVIPPFVQSVISLANQVLELIDTLELSSGSLASIMPADIANLFSDISISDSLMGKVSDFSSSLLSGVANASVSAGTGIANILIAFLLAIYYLMDKPRLQRLGRRVFLIILKQEKYDKFVSFLKQVDEIFLNYIKGNLIEAFIVGSVNCLFMFAFGMPYILLVSIIVGITNLAPTFGPIVGAALGALFLFIENPVYALIFLIFTLVLQTVDGYIIKPKFFGGSLGVSSLLILVMIIVGGRLFGVVGILLAIPYSAVLSILANKFWVRYKEKNSIEEPEEEL